MDKELIKEAIIEALKEYENNKQQEEKGTVFWRIAEALSIVLIGILLLIRLVNMPIFEGKSIIEIRDYNKKMTQNIMQLTEEEVMTVSETNALISGFDGWVLIGLVILGFMCYYAFKHSKQESIKRVTFYVSLLAIGLPLGIAGII